MNRLAAIGRRLTLPLKVATTACVFAYVASHVELAGIARVLANLSAPLLISIVVLLLTQHLLIAVRLRMMARTLAVDLRFGPALDSQLVGAFFSQSFLTFVAGDGMRAWMLRRSEVPLREAAGAVFLDRVAGFASLLLLVVLSLPSLLELAPSRQGLGVAAAAGVLVLLGLSGLAVLWGIADGRAPARLVERLALGWVRERATRVRALLSEWQSGSAIVLLGMGVQITNIVAIFAIARAIGLDVELFECATLVPSVILVSMLPISVGGWGVREGAMIIGLGLIGIGSDPAVAVSVLFGAGLAIAALPGAAVWLRQRGRAARRDEPIAQAP